MSKNYFIYTHSNSNEDTVGKFYYRNNPLISEISVIDLLKYKGDTIFTNAERIYNNYSSLQKVDNKSLIDYIVIGNKTFLSEKELNNLPLPINSTLLLPKSNFIEEFVSIKGKDLFLERKDFKFFFADKLWELLNDPEYVQVEKINRSGRDVDIEFINENVKIWIWCRALGRVINVSPFVENVSISKSEVGSFNLNLLPIQNLKDLSFISDTDVINSFIMNNDGNHNLDFFYKNLQYNDIVFIRFEKLILEKDFKNSYEYNFYVNNKDLPGNVWDMIGLIDRVSINSNFNDVKYNISVTGRDFMKLLIEDGSYFLSLRYLNNGNFIFGYNSEDKWFKRNVGDKSGKRGTFDNYFFPNSVKSIDDSILFIINQLSNLGIVENDDLFSSYGDRRTKRYLITGDQDQNLNVDEANGVWQIIKVLFDRSIENRRIADNSIAYVDGTILEQFNKICQKPFVEFFGDTYGDEFNLIVRQPPFTGDLIKSFLLGQHSIEQNVIPVMDYKIIELHEKDIEGYNNLEWDNTYYSWYQLCPQDSMLGEYSDLMAGGMIPIFYLEKISQIFGNHRLIINDNYLFANVISGKESKRDKSIYRRSLLNDLKYVIDSNCYLPFTRKGVITLPKGDRRIKKGIFIRVVPTGEIFYVDSVTNSLSFSKDKISRSTSIQVSRGMLEKYIYGSIGFESNGEIIEKGGFPVKFSYFNIVKTSLKSKDIIKNIDKDNIVKGTGYKNDISSKYNVKIGKINSIADRNNNPGNLTFAGQEGAIQGELKRDNTYWAKFSDPESGFEALIRQIKLDAKRGDTIRVFVEGYVSKEDNNNVEKYISDLTRLLNKEENTPLTNIDYFEFAKNVAFLESTTEVIKSDSYEVIEDTNTKENFNVDYIKREDEYLFELDDVQFDFFLNRKQFNKIKSYG
jgi:hypothetical protein